MASITDSATLYETADPHNLLDEPERDGLLRMAKLVEHVFRVPVAYMALLGPQLAVVTRIGSGSQYWDDLKTYPLAIALARPQIWPDPSGAVPDGFVSGDLRFAAGVPLRSSDGMELGILIIADTKPRPDFSRDDHQVLTELASVLAGKMELRMLAWQARELQCAHREAEQRFRNIADSAPVLIIHSGAGGATTFVNRTWLEFTGRNLEEELGGGYADTIHPQFREAVVQKYADAFHDRKPLTMEFPMRRQDGEYRWMAARGMPRVLDDGTCAGYVGCFVDITDHLGAFIDVGCWPVARRSNRPGELQNPAYQS